jgi:acetyl-CoA acyltransferase
MLSSSFSRAFSTVSKPLRSAVFIDGVRTPFCLGNTVYKDLIAVDLAQHAIKGLLTKTAIDPSAIDYVLLGNVMMEVRTSNIAREAAINVGIPNSVPSHTVTQACISANQAICTGIEKIQSNQVDVVLAGGTETFSDVVIRFSKPMRKRFLALPKAQKKGLGAVLNLFKDFKLSDLAPEAPAIANYTTGEVMGHSSDRLAMRFGVSRADQDEFALMSHRNASKAHQEGFYQEEIVPFQGSIEENGIKGDSTMEKLSSLKPAFIKPHGTHTAGNSSFLTDGATSGLIMSEEYAKANGFTPKARFVDYDFVGVDPFDELLLGPAYGIAKLLKRNNLTLNDIGVFEIHEAFAGQVLANLAALNSATFCEENGLSVNNGDNKIGEVPMERLNTRGGSLAIGHPFGATGMRLVTTASNRLIAEDQQYALLAACADGGLAHVCLLERY